VGRAASDNPDMPVSFIAESLASMAEPREDAAPFGISIGTSSGQFIVTRNVKDFKDSPVQAVTPSEQGDCKNTVIFNCNRNYKALLSAMHATI
jgi:hypothetical protein